MNTILSRYSTTLLPLAVGVLGILQAAQAAGETTLIDWQTITQIALLLVGTGVVYWLPLVNAKWQGAAKTGAAVGFAVLSAVVALVPDGHFTKANAILVITAIVKAVATELGVQIRTDAAKVIDAGSTSDPGVPSITTLKAPAVPLAAAEDIDLTQYVTHTVADDGSLQPVVGAAESEQSGTVPDDDAPKHLAAS
ncbi:hypothetical protein GA0004736_3426 [Curtobacterium sp. 9128]|uniref:hypothetical protein n=1 Tax=Curtobacterium sp. 9128 TaxID=1793722 RepID=UPI0007D715D5|nr:hypothetical protein [Curtobacterium sp. 9128]SBN64466.1 hypothetical protein GA0004736_3426 [Curtobacterium sp. 9128]